MTRYTWESLWRPQDRKAHVASIEDGNELNLLWGKGPRQIWSDIFHLTSCHRETIHSGVGEPAKSIRGSQGPSGAGYVEGRWGQGTIHGHLAPESWWQGNRPGWPQRFPPALIFMIFSSLLYSIKNHSLDFPWGGWGGNNLLTMYSDINWNVVVFFQG